MAPDDFRQFLDGTGKPFNDFMNSVLRAAAAKLGIPASAVFTNIRTSLPDGGVDSKIDKGRDGDAYLSTPTLWQYKARRFADVTAASLREEILGESKGYARQLIQANHAYRLCISDDADPRAKVELQDALHEIVRRVNNDAPSSLILLPSDLAAWANDYLAVVSGYLNLPLEKFRRHESCRAAATADTKVFVPPTHFDGWKNAIEVHLDWSRKPSEVALTLYGNAGVGKTRSLFEILDSLPNQRELALYTVDDRAAVDLATALTNETTQNAIIIADECLSSVRSKISAILQGSENRVRVITIDNARERARTLSAELHVTEATELELLDVLARNFDSVPLDRRLRYARVADGSMRFAIFMCRHDSEILEAGNLESVLRDAQSYYEYRFSGAFGFDDKDRDALEVVALVARLGYRDDLSNQLEALCKMLGRDPIDTITRIEKIRTRMGFIANAGRYCYVTPRPIAIVAFESAFSMLVAPNPEKFLRALPEVLVPPFQEKVSTASPEVGAIVTAFFRSWTVSRGTRIFESESDLRQFLALVAANPSEQVPILRQLVEAASPEQLGAEHANRFFFGGSVSRRLLITLAEEIAQFEEYFHDAETILLRLASNESEPSIGNNATNTWKGLFRILLSGTSLPFSERLIVLETRIRSNDPRIRHLAVSAAAAAVDRQPFRMVGAPLFGSLLPPQEWKPKTYGEYFDAIQECVALLLRATDDADGEVSESAKKALLDATTHLLWAGFIEPVRKALDRGNLGELKPKIRATVREARARLDSPHVPEPQKRSADIPALDSWLTSLAASSVHDEVVENVASDPWSHHFEEDDWRRRIGILANRLHADREAFRAELPWLNSADAKAAAELGHAFAKLDVKHQAFLVEIMDEAIRTESDSFARGYIYGLTEGRDGNFERLNAEIDRVQGLNPRLAFYIMLPAGDKVHSFDRALALVSSGGVPARLLSNLEVWVGNRKTTPQEASKAVSLLLIRARHGEVDAVDVALNFVAYQINRVEPAEKAAILKQIFERNSNELWALLDAYLQKPNRETFWFARIVSAVGELDPKRACELVARMVVSDNFSATEEAEKLIRDELSKKYPVEIMNAIGELMISEPQNFAFFVRKLRLFSTLPVAVVTTWLDRVGVKGARAIARHLDLPYIDAKGNPVVPPLTEYVLTLFEEDDRTYTEFAVGAHSLQGYWGSYADARDKEADVARAFLAHKLRRIREWARAEVAQAEHDSKTHRVREAEFGI